MSLQDSLLFDGLYLEVCYLCIHWTRVLSRFPQRNIYKWASDAGVEV